MPARIDYLDTDDLISRYQNGASARSLSQQLGVDSYVIRRILREAGITLRGLAESTRRKIPDTEVVRLYQDGESLHALGKQFGVDRYVIRRILRQAGIERRDRAAATRLTRTVAYDDAEVVRRYLAGESARALGIAYGVHERAIYRTLSEQGIRSRTITEANNLVLDRLSLEQRRERATRHAVVWEGRSYPVIRTAHPEWLHKRALTRELTRSHQRSDELHILAALPADWVDGQQVAIDRYNIDLTHGSVAVEVHSMALHPFRSEQTVCRAIDLAERGWHSVFFWPNGGHTRRITARGIAELVAHVERLDRDPAPARQYLVVRGGGELVTSGRFDVKQRTLIPTPVEPH